MPPKGVYFSAACLLFLGIFQLPYGFYTFLRIITFILFFWSAWNFYQKNHPILPWIFAVAGFIFNPIIPIYFSKTIWTLLDAAGGVLFIYAGIKH